MSYQYKNGQQPLAGYTIKRGVGKGGFGEVYFAVSDSGKEVALKTLRGRADIELRGVAHCLNLKHPNLVHIYDQRVDDQGNAWIVMEYILGESLADVLDRHPQGLPTHLAKDWFQSLARAVGFLHDHGVLHRDLKPANVFIENGTVKVGDYGLCKTIGSASERQTRNVGTVHYMAPEVGNGKYGRSVDIYACAAILYEMLVGRPPFDGDSDAEVLIKHSTETVNLATVPVAFREVVARGLNKDPEKRYTSMAEFSRAVESVPTGGQPANAGDVPPPLPLPIQMPASAKVVGPPVATRVPDHTPAIAFPVSSASMPVPIKLPVAKNVTPLVGHRQALADTFGGMIKAAILSGIGAIAVLLLTQSGNVFEWAKFAAVTFALSGGVILLSFRASRKNVMEWPLRFRMALLGVGVGALLFWLDGRTVSFGSWNANDEELISTSPKLMNGLVNMSRTDFKVLSGYVMYFAAAMGLMRWWQMAVRDRNESWSIGHPFLAGILGGILMFLWPHDYGSTPAYGVGTLIVSALVIPLASAWTVPPAPLPRKLRAN